MVKILFFFFFGKLGISNNVYILCFLCTIYQCMNHESYIYMRYLCSNGVRNIHFGDIHNRLCKWMERMTSRFVLFFILSQIPAKIVYYFAITRTQCLSRKVRKVKLLSRIIFCFGSIQQSEIFSNWATTIHNTNGTNFFDLLGKTKHICHGNGLFYQ